MTPLLLGGIIGSAALLSVGAAAIPSINYPDSSDDPSSPIDYSDTGDDSLNLYSTNSMSNIDAFLKVIRAGESSNNYGAYVGGGTFTDFSHHPALPPSNWKGVGNSHACGGYQFEPGTWKECAAALSLRDFSPDSQDRAAVFLLKRRGAYNAVMNGDIATACDLLKNEWQMFTMPRWSAVNVAVAFESNGGVS
jgi:muramidase (phage lysozyme)